MRDAAAVEVDEGAGKLVGAKGSLPSPASQAILTIGAIVGAKIGEQHLEKAGNPAIGEDGGIQAMRQRLAAAPPRADSSRATEIVAGGMAENSKFTFNVQTDHKVNDRGCRRQATGSGLNINILILENIY